MISRPKLRHLLMPAMLLFGIHAASALDLNSNGMSDVWERVYSVSDPVLDPDGDGQDNLKEAEAGTNPNDPNDSFKTTGFSISNDGTYASLTWRSAEGRYYEVEESADLMSWNYAEYAQGEYEALGTSVTLYREFASHPRIFFRVRGYPEYDYDEDRDGLAAWEERLLGTDPYDYDGDTDNDGMRDDFEFIYDFDPLSDADGDADADGDVLSNAMESRLGTNPRETDTNGNGVSDAAEDKDQDGLTNIQEFVTYLTDPTQPDSDGDTKNDGWEIKYGYSALINNETDSNPANNSTADPDVDGLNNVEESQIDTNPNEGDTDGDTFSDFEEDRGGSDAGGAASTPSNPGGVPGGPSSPPPPTIPVMVNFGDHSGSHSEKYRVNLTPLEGDANTQRRYRTNRQYGVTQTETFYLPAGAKYKVTLEHIATDPQYIGPPSPDYDYTLNFTSGSTNSAITIATQDPSGMLGVHDESVQFYASGKDATLYTPWLKSVAAAPFPFDKDRKKIGVGEVLNLTIKPSSLPSPSWTLAGTPGSSSVTPSGSTASFEAGIRACTPQVKVTSLGTDVKIDYNVVQPSGEQATKASENTYAAGTQGAGMVLSITTLPDDVSFNNVEVIEVDKGTSNVTGFFSSYSAASLQHHPTATWTRLSVTNKWSDVAFITGYGTSSTWAQGTFQWAIEVRWRVFNKETGQGEFLANRTQVFTMHDTTGRTTITKLGQSVTRTP